MTAVSLIAIVMAAMTSFFIASMAVVNQQSGNQAAIEVADAATDLVHTLKGLAVVAGLDKSSADVAYSLPVPGVLPYQFPTISPSAT